MKCYAKPPDHGVESPGGTRSKSAAPAATGRGQGPANSRAGQIRLNVPVLVDLKIVVEIDVDAIYDPRSDAGSYRADVGRLPNSSPLAV